MRPSGNVLFQLSFSFVSVSHGTFSLTNMMKKWWNAHLCLILVVCAGVANSGADSPDTVPTVCASGDRRCELKCHWSNETRQASPDSERAVYLSVIMVARHDGSNFCQMPADACLHRCFACGYSDAKPLFSTSAASLSPPCELTGQRRPI